MRTIPISKIAYLALAAASMAAASGDAARAAEPRTLSVVLTGQSTIRSDVRVTTPTLIQSVAPMLAGDAVFTNYEVTTVEKEEAGPGFVTPPGALDSLKAMGFNLLALSNNHSWDRGLAGVQTTLREVGARKIAHAGIGADLKEASAPGYLSTPNGTVALVSMASGLIPLGASATPTRPGVNELRLEGGVRNVDTGKPNEEDARVILQSIGEAAKHADLVIAYQHNHVFSKDFVTMMAEELPERLVPPEWIKTWAHREVDAGADIVVLHGAPLMHGIEIYKGKPIFYDLGNFMFNLVGETFDEPIIWESTVVHVEFEGKTLKSIKLQPIALNKQGRGEGLLFLQTRGLPAPAMGDRARIILERLAAASKPFGTTLEVKGEFGSTIGEIKLGTRNAGR